MAGVAATAVLVTLSAILTGRLTNPQQVQSRQLFDQLLDARLALGERPPRLDAGCEIVGHVETRLTGEPGLVDIRPAWSALWNSARALNAVCGQATMLQQPSHDSLTMIQARRRWQQGIDRELDVACTHLREAAIALARTTPC